MEPGNSDMVRHVRKENNIYEAATEDSESS
jgi:hypothetical protein